MTGAWLLVAGLMAATPPVLVVSDDADSALVRRTSAELRVLGFVPEPVPAPSDPLDDAALFALAARRGAERTGLVVILPGPGRVGAWVVEPQTGTIRSRELRAEEATAPETVSVKLAESIRALFLELPPRPASPPEPTPEPAQEPTPTPVAPHAPRLWLGLEGGAVGSRVALGGIGAAVRLRLSERLAVELEGHTSLVPTRLEAAEGSAALSEQQLVVGSRLHFLEEGAWLQVGVGLGAFVERFAVEGEAVPPLEAAKEEQWTAGGKLDLLASMRVASRIRLTLGLHAGASPRSFSVHVADREVTRWGWLTWGGRLGLEVGVWP